MSEPVNNLNVRGAVDLGALAAAREAQERAANAPAPTAGTVLDVTEENFESAVLQRSMTVPVVLDLWAEWCQPCKTLTPILESLVVQYAGRFVLAKVDVEAQQRLAQAFQVQSIPAVFAVISGQPVPLFQGALPEVQIRQYLDALLAQAEKMGVTGTAAPAPAEEAPEAALPEPASDPDEDAAYEAMEASDWSAAQAAFDRQLARDPSNESARIGKATAGLYERIGNVDHAQAIAEADAAPDDVTRQTLAADIAAVGGDVEGALSRLIETVRRTAGDERTQAREHLVGLFDLIGQQDPRVIQARTALANALF